MELTAAPAELVRLLEEHRPALTTQCRWMLGSRSEADDAVQETLIRAWQAYGTFEGRGPLLAWLRRIARNVCVDMVRARQRRAVPAEPEVWDVALSEPVAARPAPPADDPAERAVVGDEVRRAFVAALLHLSPRERSALLLCDVLRWRASEAAELLGTSVASVNSALQRARATLAGRAGRPGQAGGANGPDAVGALDDEQRVRLHSYVDAFQRHDVGSLASLLCRYDGAGPAAVTAGRPG